MRAFNLFAAIGIMISGCVTNSTITHIPAAQLQQQADAWDRAIIAKDLTGIAQNISESFRHIDSQGNMSSKSEFIAAITSEKLVIFPYKPENVEIRFYGGVALVTGTTQLYGTYNGMPFSTHYRYTDTYADESGVWRVINVQTTEISR